MQRCLSFPPLRFSPFPRLSSRRDLANPVVLLVHLSREIQPVHEVGQPRSRLLSNCHKGSTGVTSSAIDICEEIEIGFQRCTIVPDRSWFRKVTKISSRTEENHATWSRCSPEFVTLVLDIIRDERRMCRSNLKPDSRSFPFFQSWYHYRHYYIALVSVIVELVKFECNGNYASSYFVSCNKSQKIIFICHTKSFIHQHRCESLNWNYLSESRDYQILQIHSENKCMWE